ncbi:MAG: hypothetical protein JO205_04535, partial [Pseudolabrys sp.]|nr:hypothetical protein [Pseudolabrys sp.]
MRTISLLAATAVLESRTGSNCTFETLAACLKNKTGISDMCEPNSGSE